MATPLAPAAKRADTHRCPGDGGHEDHLLFGYAAVATSPAGLTLVGPLLGRRLWPDALAGLGCRVLRGRGRRRGRLGIGGRHWAVFGLGKQHFWNEQARDQNCRHKSFSHHNLVTRISNDRCPRATGAPWVSDVRDWRWKEKKMKTPRSWLWGYRLPVPTAGILVCSHSLAPRPYRSG